MKKKYLAILVYGAMAAVLFLKLGVVRKLFELSLWPDMTFYTNLGLQPGVLLPILGSVLTQVSGLPVLGVLLVLLSLACLTSLVKKLCGDRMVSFIPAVAAFLFIAGFDYSLYVFRAQGLLFSQTLGLIFATLPVLWWVRTESTSLKSVIPILIAVVGYPLIGAYSLVSLLAIAIKALCGKKWLPAIVAVFSGVLIPLFYTHLVFTHIDTHYTFYAGFPYMDFVDNHRRFIPLAIAVVSLVMLPSLEFRKAESAKVSMAIVAALLVCLGVFPYWNRNFHLEIAMQHSIEKNDWDRTAKLAWKSAHPSRIIVMYRNIALMNSGELCDRMFAYPNESVNIDTPAQISQTEVCAPVVFFYNGLINYSTRWAWEMSMMFQRTLERYKYQAKVALFTQQENPELVEKYLKIIGRNMYQRRWVRKYRSMLHDPSLLERDPEYRMFRQLDAFEELKYMSSAVVENTILNHYMLQEDPKGVMLDASLAAAMTSKDIDTFWYYYDRLLETGRKIPVHVGEAAILFAYIGRNQAEIDAVARDLGGQNSPTVRRFINFSSQASAGDVESCRNNYGDTYWYYSYFVKSITTD